MILLIWVVRLFSCDPHPAAASFSHERDLSEIVFVHHKKSLVLEKEPFKTSGSFLMLNNRDGGKKAVVEGAFEVLLMMPPATWSNSSPLSFSSYSSSVIWGRRLFKYIFRRGGK